MKKQVKEKTYNELLVNKSKFITYLFPVSSLEEIKDILKTLKDEYKDSTHICYAYILDEDTYKYYDDGEPSSTAGAPIYQVLKNNDLIYSLCVVIRYFGGVKLGVGGLIKAYTNSCLACLNKSELVVYEKLDHYTIDVSYADFEKIEHYLKINNITINSKSFNDSIIIEVIINEENAQKLINNFAHFIKISKQSL